MSEKREFIEKAMRPGTNVSVLCTEFGISRQTGHKWLRRYRERGPLGLVEHSRRPRSAPDATAEELVLGIVHLRERHPSWGAQKIAGVLRRELGEDGPSRSTVGRVLTRAGKVRRRRRRPVRVWAVEGKPRVELRAPNDLWTLDFKGWWRARNGERCEPLTVRDAFSRYVLTVELVASTSAKRVRPILEQLFRTHGVPLAMLNDNGSPFACTQSRGGLTVLSAWLASLGIRLVRSRPGCPQDNGGHERMHRDLSELQLSPARTRRAQQRECESWLVDFNHVRPHDALGGKTPAEVYQQSPRRSLIPKVPVYPPEWLSRRVSRHGTIRLNSESIFVGAALAGHLIGLYQETALRWRLRFFDIDLGTVESLPVGEVLAGRTSDQPGIQPQEGPESKPRCKRLTPKGVSTEVSAMS
jgi:transposase InsO family protein